MIKLTDANYKKVISEKEKLVVIDFWADWCGPCKVIAPIFEKIANDNPDVVFAKANVDECSDLSGEFTIRNIPTICFLKNGQVVEKKVGTMPESTLQSLVDSNK